jgi:hypothetical protein
MEIEKQADEKGNMEIEENKDENKKEEKKEEPNFTLLNNPCRVLDK